MVANVSNRSRRCRNGYRHVARSLLAPNSGVVSKIGGRTVIPFVPGNVGWPPGGQRNRGIGAAAPATPGPPERPRGDDDPRRLPPALRARPCHAPSHGKAQAAASPLTPHNSDSVLAPLVLGSNLRPSPRLLLSFSVGETPHFLFIANSVDRQYCVVQSFPFRVLESCTTYKLI
jgi:hypothetical protein